MSQSDTSTLKTADGISLKLSLQRSLRRKKRNALLLVAPLFLFILITFIIPIAYMLVRSVDNQIFAEILPTTAPLLAKWDPLSGNTPDEEVFKAFITDGKVAAQAKTINRLGKRLNYEKSGISSLFRKTGRNLRKLEPEKLTTSYKEALIKIDKKWGQVDTWEILHRESGKYTKSYFLSAVDMKYDANGMQWKDDDSRIYLNLFKRTLWLSFLITFLTVLLGYPIAYLLATLKTSTSNLLIILVLLPFWTSLLVRTSSWIALLQKEGVINDFLFAIGLITDEGRLAMIHNQTGTVIAMTHILLPFMILPLFSVMKTINPSYVRAARSMGATSFTAFRRVYFPNTIAGIGAGGILVFILSIGYYITPALVGGTQGTLISNFIAYHISGSLNWGLAAALGTILLLLVVALYILYDKIVGIDNMKLG
ncbi:ABC transporter permease [uncultured Cocleimonas sp.]|uniref:ABC transporter permease n=1 Tax=uncultured Cocleimonas sp. TaxID=1051587 RepID=UPI00262AB3EA|nr:ABC transporter permease [uncultured Cocleimonas sp.]